MPVRITPAPVVALPSFPVAGIYDPAPMPLPLDGLVLLAVEDSRFAAEALRLFSRRAGARLRRAADLQSAAYHLSAYEPDAILIDLGLPDGRGEDLIQSLRNQWGARAPVLVAMSGDLDRREGAMAAGADTFFDKPLMAMDERVEQLRMLLSARGRAAPSLRPSTSFPSPDELVHALLDRMGLIDDLQRIEAALAGAGPGAEPWLADFLHGIARQADDRILALALEGLRAGGHETVIDILAALRQRLAETAAFRRDLAEEMPKPIRHA